MKCLQVQKYIHAYLDGELGQDTTTEVERHLDECGRCREQMEFEAAFIDQVRSGVEKHEAPASLVAGVRAALDDEKKRSHRRRSVSMLAGFAAAAGLVAVVWAGLWPLMAGRGGDLPDIPPLEEQVVENVVKNPPLELQRADASEVSECFRGKVAFAVEPPDLSGGGQAELVGARLYNVGDSDAAYIVYDVGGQLVTMQMFEAGRDALSELPGAQKVARLPTKNGGYVTTTRGYTVGVFTSRGVTYSLTSADMDERAMATLIEKMR